MLNLVSHQENESKSTIDQIGKYIIPEDTVRIYKNRNFHTLRNEFCYKHSKQ